MADQQHHATTGHEYFSLADIGAYEEEIIEGYRGDLDANASLPPLTHDVYAVRVTYAEKWPGAEGEVLAADPTMRWRKQTAKDGVLMYLTWVHIETTNNSDPANDGRGRDEVITTYPNKRGMTGAQALLQGLDVDTIALNSHQAQMKAIDGAIAGEGGMAGVEYDWEASVYDKDAKRKDKKGNIEKDADGEPKLGVERWSLRGMNRFPKNEDGTFRPDIGKDDGFLMKDESGKSVPVEQARARNFIRRYVPISKLQKSDGKLEQQLADSVANVAVTAARRSAPSNTVATQPVTPATQQVGAAAGGVLPRPPARPPMRRVTT